MKVKSILASLGACAIAVSAMAVTASADVDYDISKIAEGDKNFTCYILGDSKDGSVKGMLTDRADVEKITAIKWTIECPEASDPSKWYGGAFGIQCAANSWDTKEWCVNEETDKKVVATKVNDTTYEVVWDVSLQATEDQYLTAVWQNYDSGASTLKSVTLVGLDSVSDGGDKTDDKKDDATTTSTTTTTAANKGGGNAATAGAKTGDAGVGMAVGALGLAAVAAVVSRKKH